MTIQEAFECMQKGTEVQTSRSKGKIESIEPHDYMMGNVCFKVDGGYYAAGCLSKIVPKKRYWIWDVQADDSVKKTNYYIDENGNTTNGENLYNKRSLIKKHENEFVDVEGE